MPLKSRTAAPAASSTPADAPVTSRTRADTLDQQEAPKTVPEPAQEAPKNHAPPPETEAGKNQEVITAPKTRKPRQPRQPKVAVTPGEGNSEDPKARLSEIAREMKQLRSDYTAQSKALEAEFVEKAKALRSEYDLLNRQVADDAFSL